MDKTHQQILVWITSKGGTKSVRVMTYGERQVFFTDETESIGSAEKSINEWSIKKTFHTWFLI